jgi:hypothetical protein
MTRYRTHRIAIERAGTTESCPEVPLLYDGRRGNKKEDKFSISNI